MNRKYLLKKIGAAPPASKMVIEDQDAYDIINRMVIKHRATVCDYDKIAGDFAGINVFDTAENIFNFCKNNLAYQEETVNEQNISSPQTILGRGHCDCKGYALFIGGVLDALNRRGWDIKWKYRFASDDLFNEIPGHVFVVINDGGGEIWVDPVLANFNQDHYFPYYQDKRVNIPATVAGCGCDAIGATTAQTGQMIMKLAPALAVIPVVGWIGSAAAEVIGGIVSIVGSKWNQSPDVRWLIQLYEFYALGIASAHSDNTIRTEADAQPAQAFFSVVLGVPVGGRNDFNILQSGDGNTNTPTGQTATQRAQNYLIYKNLQNVITLDQATAAANIAAGLNPNNYQVGGWAGLTPAPSTISKDAANAPTLLVNQNGQLTDAAGVPVISSNNNILLLAAAAAVLFIMLK